MTIEDRRKIAFDMSNAGHFVQSRTGVARNYMPVFIPPDDHAIIIMFQDEADGTYFGPTAPDGAAVYAADVERLRAMKEQLESNGQIFRLVGVSEIPDAGDERGGITGGAFPSDVATHYGGVRPEREGSSFTFNRQLFRDHLRRSSQELPDGTPQPTAAILCVDGSGSMSRADIELGFMEPDVGGNTLVGWIEETYGMTVSVRSYGSERWPDFAASQLSG